MLKTLGIKLSNGFHECPVTPVWCQSILKIAPNTDHAYK